MKAIFFAIISFALLSSAVFAAPGVPHQFYGTVSINGAPAPDGTAVSAKIGSATVSTTTSYAGKYGYTPTIFYVDDPNGDRYGSTVVFYVNDIYAGASATFSNGKSTELDLAITVSSPPQVTTSSGGGGGGGGGGSSTTTVTQTQTPPETTVTQTTDSAPTGPCVEKWTCTEWSKCDGNLQKRTCKDENKCGTIEELPMTSQPCSLYEETQKSSSTGSSNGITGRMLSYATGSGAPVIGGIVFIAVAGYFLVNKKAAPKRKKGYSYK